ncbi:unnamed protein product, partial [Symbiodinium sp. CCMP2456]
MYRNSVRLVAILLAAIGSLATAAPYVPVVLPPGAIPALGPGVIPAPGVFGKEYSHNIDHDFMGGVDPEQVVAWDGLGGTLDGIDYSGSRGPNFPREEEVDALANHGDALYTSLYNPSSGAMPDTAHLVFTIDDAVAGYGGPIGPGTLIPAVPGAFVPPSGPVALSNGNTIGGSADISVEEAGVYAGFAVQHLWTPAPLVNGMAAMRDVDGLELWGPEPGTAADSNKYSLDVDVTTGGASVWNYDLGLGTSSPYISHALIVDAVESLLGTVPTTAFSSSGDFPGREAVNLDAMMVRDIIGDDMIFETDPAGVGSDSIIFSIRQIVDPADPDGFYATGSELFVLNAPVAGGPVTAGYLFHGGHFWDHAYAISDLRIAGANALAYIDVNGIEAIGELVVPEPSTLGVALIGFAMAAA